jgi:GNAT superfamily N-acetyltransferase
VKIELLTGQTVSAYRFELGELLSDAVRNGASIGFVLPLTDGEVEAYWREVGAGMAAGRRLLFAAFDDDGRLVGSAQLALESRANGRHRAEVQKVMVRAAHRKRGIGAALMARVEAEARARGRFLLFLDTSVGEAGATKFYDRLGYVLVGGIPDFAASPDGTLAPNAIYYKWLSAPTPGAARGNM